MLTHSVKHCGFVALLGLPNAGKSLLLNQIINKKVAIVNHKRNTTRLPVKGILHQLNSQVIFIDTPGIDAIHGDKLIQQMVELAWQTAGTADLIAVVIDSKIGLSSELKQLLVKLQSLPQKKYLILNKIDLVEKSTLLRLVNSIIAILNFTEVFMVSATNGSGIKDLVNSLVQAMPEGEFLYPEDLYTDLSLATWAAEITREAAMFYCHNEVPYELAVQTTKIIDDPKGVFLYQDIQVPNTNHRMIVIGKDGRKIKSIGMNARLQMQQFLDKNVHLFITVKVCKNLRLLSQQ